MALSMRYLLEFASWRRRARSLALWLPVEAFTLQSRHTASISPLIRSHALHVTSVAGEV